MAQVNKIWTEKIADFNDPKFEQCGVNHAIIFVKDADSMEKCTL